MAHTYIQSIAGYNPNGGGGSGVTSVGAISLPLKAQVTLASGGSLARTTDAYSMAYTPAVSGNWNSQPSTIQQALDMIAASVGPI